MGDVLPYVHIDAWEPRSSTIFLRNNLRVKKKIINFAL